MVNRIQEILEKYNLTAAKLADKLDVPRSTISHIFAERNKPSLEFVQKVLTTFPEISTRWLLKGEGSIFADEANLFSGSQPETFHKTSSATEETYSPYKSKDSINLGTIKDQSEYANVADINSARKTSEAADNHLIREGKSTQLKQPKRIVKLITLYSDNSFEEFNPFSG